MPSLNSPNSETKNLLLNDFFNNEIIEENFPDINLDIDDLFGQNYSQNNDMELEEPNNELTQNPPGQQVKKASSKEKIDMKEALKIGGNKERNQKKKKFSFAEGTQTVTTLPQTESSLFINIDDNETQKNLEIKETENIIFELVTKILFFCISNIFEIINDNIYNILNIFLN